MGYILRSNYLERFWEAMNLIDRLKQNKLSVIGLGYVGMPIVVKFANRGTMVIGFDINKKKNYTV